MAGHDQSVPSKLLTHVYKANTNDFDLGCDTDKLVVSENEVAKKHESLRANKQDSLSPEDKKETEPAEAKEADSDPFRHSPCNKYYWKVIAMGYLAVCVLLAIIYVAIYAEQHGLYGSYYDNLENLGRPLNSQAQSDAGLTFIDAPYTEWLSQRWTHLGTNLSNWPVLPRGLEAVHQVLGSHIQSSPVVWTVTDNAVLLVAGVTGKETALQLVNASEGASLKVTPPTRLAIAANESVYVVQTSSITIIKCSSVSAESCFTVVSLTKLDLGQVSTVTVSASSGQLWIGSDKGLYVSTITSTSINVPVKISSVDGPVYSIAWRSPLGVSMVTKEVIPNERKWSGCDLLKVCTEELMSKLAEQDDLKLPCGMMRTNFITNASAQLHIDTSSTYTTTGRHTGNSTLLEMWDHQLLTNSRPSLALSHHPPTKADLFGLLAVGDGWKLHFFDGKQWWFEWASLWRDGLGGVVDGPVTSLAFVPTGELFIGNNVSLSRLNVNYTFDRLGPLQGLPTGNITSLTFLSATTHYPDPFLGKRQGDELGTIVMATEQGLIIFDVASSEFVAYFYGRRWLPGNFVTMTTTVTTDTIVAISDGGWAVIRAEDWTLQQKAQHYQAILPRHTRQPGIVADCPLTNFDPATCAPHTTDNDGLWTSWLVAAEAFRYQVEKEESARENAWQLFKGMEFLNTVTGVKGLMARSVVRSNVSVSGGVWHNSTTEPGWKWKGDTSSDEVVGHMFALPIVYDLVASPGVEKAEVYTLIDNIVGYIKRNKYYLIDVTGLPTRWGVWAPEQINLNQSWADEHGLNSLQILAYLLSAYRVTGKGEYLEGWLNLFNGTTGGLANHYGINMINQKITFPVDDNFSDDELAFLPYFTYMYALKLIKASPISAEGLLGTADLSLQQTWKYVGPARSSAWSTIYCYGLGVKDEAIRSLVWNLRTWPLELVQWETQNSHRLDIRFNPEPDRDFHYHSQSVRVLPANERGQLRWNGNPFQLDSGGASSEMDPGPWLMPYWMARWAGLL